ncbi:hypothetical protein ATI61_10987 [Archangium gephyra]|uniref:Uncharacterized protein n=1 Tax=Archangium gephyra TaxID=48 RepID=A0AAC8Q2F6_9BACT|nr:hypothetical protein [Archangium gephyra]AKI99718.1 Hypothetical protein AA314_01345 [Archangium gephyra]REG27750.1 hypothetical protein ATI61_10987 [Archangium gephyra]
MTMSRRFFMGSGVIGAATLAAGLTVTGPAGAAEACFGGSSGREDELIKATADSLTRFMDANPEAAGLRDVENLLKSTYPAEVDSEDDRLLQGALYLEAQRLFEMRAGPPSEEALAKGLSAPVNVEKMNPEYFSTLLERTKARVACDAEYARQVSTASEQARGLAINCHGRWWLCGLIIVVVVVVIILL